MLFLLDEASRMLLGLRVGRREALVGFEPSSLEKLERELLNWMRFYNERRLHSSLGYRTPREAWEEGLKAGAITE